MSDELLDEAHETITNMIKQLEDLRNGEMFVSGSEAFDSTVAFSRISVMLGKNIMSLGDYLAVVGDTWAATEGGTSMPEGTMLQ